MDDYERNIENSYISFENEIGDEKGKVFVN